MRAASLSSNVTDHSLSQRSTRVLEIPFHISGQASRSTIRLEQVTAQTMGVSHEKDAGADSGFSGRIDRLFRTVQHVVRLEEPAQSRAESRRRDDDVEGLDAAVREDSFCRRETLGRRPDL